MRPASLVVKVGARACAVPIEYVVETMRLLPIEPIAGALPFVMGLAIVRGAPLVVIDAGVLLGARSRPTRFVTLRVGERQVVLAVDAVVGMMELDPSSFERLPPLAAVLGDVVDAIAPLDDGLLMVLRAARIVETELS